MSSNQGGATYDLVFRHSTEPYTTAKCEKGVMDGSIISLISSCSDYSLFLKLIVESGYYDLLNNPLSRVSLFLPRNSVFMSLSDSQLQRLRAVDVRTFVGYHISSDVFSKSDMMYTRYAIKTKSDVMLEVNGLGLEPKVGGFSKGLNGTSTQWLVSSVTSSIDVGSSVINIIDLPILVV